jgi:DNA-binding MarR family transcriptional regulator
VTQENRGLFLMLPDCLLDDTELTETSIIGFARLMRHCQQQRVSYFAGSLRKLARIIKISKTTTARLIPAWIGKGLILKEIHEGEETRDIMMLHLLLPALWERNIDYSLQKCPNLGQSTAENPSLTVPNKSTSVPKRDETVPPRDDSVPSWDETVPPVSTNEGTKIEEGKNEEGEEARAPEPPVFSSQRKEPAVETEGGDDPEPTEKRPAIRISLSPQPGNQGTGKPAPSSTRAPQEKTPTETPTLPTRTKEVLPGPEESENSLSGYKTFGKPESKKSAPPPKLRITRAPTSTPPKQLSLKAREEPRPPTRAELERDRAEFERLLWELAERKMKTRYPTGVRRLNWNKDGVADIIEAGYTLEEIGRAFDRFRPFEIHTFDMQNLYKWLPNLLSGRLTNDGNQTTSAGNIGGTGKRRFSVPPVLGGVRS